MKKKDLLKIAYSYYPYKLDCSLEKAKYLTSKEFLNLCNKIEFHKKRTSKTQQKFEERLKKVCNPKFTFENITYFEWMDRCFTYQYAEKKSDSFFLLKIFESIIIKKYYVIKYFKVKTLNNNYTYKEITKNEFKNNDFLFNLQTILKDNEYIELSKSLITEQIEFINFDDIPMGNFTYFNAFFNSQNF